jgi:transcriptional repressor NrdR
MVVKRDNRREPFNRDKMREGIQRACQKRPISPATIERLVSEVEYSLQDCVLEVPSVEIGQRILKRLYDMDAVAYVRFASVYRSFGDVDTFMSELRKVKRSHQERNRIKNKIKTPSPGQNGKGGDLKSEVALPHFSSISNVDFVPSLGTDRLAKV